MIARLAVILLAVVPVACGVEVDTAPQPLPVKEQVCSLFGAGRQPIKPSLLAKLTPCCDGQGLLAPAILVPETFAPILEKGPKQTLCVPRVYADPSYQPPACESPAGTGSCVSTCIPLVKGLYGSTPRGSCGPGEVCLQSANQVMSWLEGIVCGWSVVDSGAPRSDGLGADAGPKTL